MSWHKAAPERCFVSRVTDSRGAKTPTTTKLGSALTSGVTSPKIVAAKAGALVAARFA
jgi:hypothetical protein